MNLVWWLVLLLLGFVPDAHAARIGDVLEVSAWEQAARFISMRDSSVKLALAGAVLLGLSCGVFGAFLVVRKLALVGDVLSHAVLPGVTAGFLWNSSKDPVTIFFGATIAGLIGTAFVTWLTRTTKLKEDTALALVLSVFFAIGVVMLGVILRLPGADKSGVDKCLFGQAAALSGTDITLMAAVAVTILATTALFYKELLVTSFDAAFARTIGLPVAWIHHLFMFLLSAAVVVALQAVGVVLVSAMLITPAASAYLLTNRMHKMVVISAVLGVISSILGAFLSFLGNNLPTGPCMVIAASTIFTITLLFSPLHGVLPRWLNQLRRARRSASENALKTIYSISEIANRAPGPVSIEELAARMRTDASAASKTADRLANDGLAVFEHNRAHVRLSVEGIRRAEAVVRKHRLWELYLTEKANYRPDHVHADAEEMEHLLGDEAIQMLERRLGFPERDPHGRSIPRPQ